MKLRKLKKGSRGLRRQAVKSHLTCGLRSEHLTIFSLFLQASNNLNTSWTVIHTGMSTITRLLGFVTGILILFLHSSLDGLSAFLSCLNPSPELEFLRLHKGSFYFCNFWVYIDWQLWGFREVSPLHPSPCSHRSKVHTWVESWPVRKGLARWISR